MPQTFHLLLHLLLNNEVHLVLLEMHHVIKLLAILVDQIVQSSFGLASAVQRRLNSLAKNFFISFRFLHFLDLMSAE